MKPYGVISDTHHHDWDAFSVTLPSGINNRLQIILDETQRCAMTVSKAGGDTLIHGGDLFHVRGKLAPMVLNPTLHLYRDLIKSGMNIIINAGNHDLAGKEADEVSSAITAMAEVGCTVVNEPVFWAGKALPMAIVPWTPSIVQLKKTIEDLVPVGDRAVTDLIIHAPIDGTIKGLPDHGLTPGYLASLGYRRVLAGHYHHHADHGFNVYSIGATTHQTWSDVGSKAGFLIVDDTGVHWHASHAPSFVEIDASVDPTEYPLVADGNYCKITITSAKSSDVEAVRAHLMSLGAKGVVVISEKPTAGVAARAGGTVSYKAGTTLEKSITDFIDTRKDFKKPSELAIKCAEILTKARSIA